MRSGKKIVESCRPQIAFELTEVDISHDTQLLQEYGNDMPVTLLGGREIGRHFVRKERLPQVLEEAVRKNSPQ